SDLEFLEIETPVLTKPTPEGARDYLVPSRVHPGEFYALPQSPQIYTQLLVVAGFDRYFQLSRCFRDEDLRYDRQPEFTQIDIEASFVTQDDVLAIVEAVLVALWDEAGHRIERPFTRLSWRDAMERYGTDKPDLRYDFEIKDFSRWAKTDGKIAGEAVRQKLEGKDARLRGIIVPVGALFEPDPVTGKPVFAHHPFTSPHPDDVDKLDSDPFACRALHYDAVYNGNELGSGSIRITDPAIQRTVFRHLGLSPAEIDARFGFLLTALAAGAPPHGGFAIGFDRTAMLLVGAGSMRDVIAF